MNDIETITEEVRRVLGDADRALSVREIIARCDIEIGPVELQPVLSQLRQKGELATEEHDDGRRRYRLGLDDGEPAPAQSSPARGSRTGIADRIREALRAHGDWMSTTQLQDVVGARGVQGGLSYLRRQGEVEADTKRGRTGRWRLAQPAEPDPDPVSPMFAGPAAERPRVAAEKPALKSEAPSRFAYRSDGTLRIEPTGSEPLELGREDAERLYRYLTGIHAGVEAVLAGGEA